VTSRRGHPGLATADYAEVAVLRASPLGVTRKGAVPAGRVGVSVRPPIELSAKRTLLEYAGEGSSFIPVHRNFDDASVVGSTELQTEVMRGFIMGGGLA
jgi:hypothetical protein